jgi:glycosyltransferase involved in cell wall biosynthesis
MTSESHPPLVWLRSAPPVAAAEDLTSPPSGDPSPESAFESTVDYDGPSRVAYVLPVYNEEAGVAAFHAALVAETDRRRDLAFEFVYVDDGSRDSSLEQLVKLRAGDPRVTVVQLSRNYGHQNAVTAGLDLVAEAGAADAVIVMDTDLQDPPRVSLEMIARWEDGIEVVYAQRRSRQDSVFKRATAFGFYWALDRLASIAIPRNVGDFRLMDARVVTEVTRYREHDRFLRGIVAHVGFRQEALLFDRDERYAGVTGYPLKKMISLAASGILGFSTAPLRMISRLGYAISVLSVLLGVYVLAIRLFRPEDAVPGWAFLGVGMFMLSGIQLVMMGVIGSYVGRVYVEAQDRPLYTVSMLARDGADRSRGSSDKARR